MARDILVLGGTGRTGRRVVQLLSGRGVAARVASRHPDSGGTLFDWSRPETHSPALAGVDAVYLVAPEMVTEPSPFVGPFLDRAVDAGVGRVVAVSAMGIDERTDAQAPGLRRMEQQIRDSGVEWTILRPSAFAQNFSEGFLLPGILEARAVVMPTGEGRVAFVDAGDIAAVAAAALTEPGHAKAQYNLTGPEALSFGEAAAIIAAAAGTPIAHHDVSSEVMAGILDGAGVPRDYAAGLLGVFAQIRTGGLAGVTDDVARVTGRPATSFAAFARTAALAWC